MADPKAPTLGDARKAAEAIARARPDVALVMLFGSVARGEATGDSDIDLAVVLNDFEPGSVRAEIAGIVRSSSVPVAAASAWHVAAGYSNDIDRKWADAEAQAAGMVQLAHDCSACAERAFRRTVGVARPDLSKTVNDALALLRRDAPRLTGVEIAG